MSTRIKVWIIVAVSLIIVGAIIFGGAMNMLNWDFSRLSTVKFETNTYEISDEYKDIMIETSEANIELVPSDSTKTLVVCKEKRNAKHSVRAENGALVIELVDTRKWYEHISFINFKSPKITVCLPESEYGKLSVKSSTGDVIIPGDFAFESIDISLSTGDVVNSAAAETVEIKTSTGSITAKGQSAHTLALETTTGIVNLSDSDAGNVRINVTTGLAILENLKCESIESDGNTGDLTLRNVIASGKLSVERDTGDIKLDGCDAAEIYIETDTGHVSGTLLSDKVFFAETDTGRVNVPKTISGGRCEITTDTGNIRIDVVQ